jgi:hypothetical protein
VDVVLAPARLPAPSAWSKLRVDALPGGLWASPQGIHLGWLAYRFYPEGSTSQYIDKAVPWLIVTTISSTDGTVLAHDEHPLFPDGILSGSANVWSMAGRPDGSFAVGYKWWENGGGPQRVAFGKVGTPGLSLKLTLPAASVDPIAQTAAAWDGEAFAFHAYGSPGVGLYVARVDQQGTVLLPFTKYGSTMNIDDGIVGHRTSTNAESGRTYVMDAAGKRLLNGHLRDGTPLPNAPKYIDPVGSPADTSGGHGLVASDPAGAWVSWHQDEGVPLALAQIVQRTTLDGEPTSASVHLTAQPLGDPDGECLAGLVSKEGGVEVLQAGPSAMYRTVVKGVAAEEPFRFMHGNGKDDSCLIAELFPFVWNGETWLAYSHNASYLRVVKVKDGCTYPYVPVALP